jgi:hypothetical protein
MCDRGTAEALGYFAQRLVASLWGSATLIVTGSLRPS